MDDCPIEPTFPMADGIIAPPSYLIVRGLP